MKQRPFFPLFFRNRLKLQYLTIEQRGELFTALYDYAEDGMYPNFDGVLGMAFEVFRDDIDSSLEHYRKRSEQNKLNGQKGAEARWGNKNGERHNQDGENSQSEAEVEKEGEDDDQSDADTEDVIPPADETVYNHFLSVFHRNPSKEFLKTTQKSSLAQQDIILAIEASRNPDILNPEGYATKLIQAWEISGIPNRYKRKPVTQSFETENQKLEPWEQEWLDDLRARYPALEIESK